MPQVHKKSDIIKYMQVRKDVQNVVTSNILRDSDIHLVNTNRENVISTVISVTCTTRRKKHLTRKGLWES